MLQLGHTRARGRYPRRARTQVVFEDCKSSVCAAVQPREVQPYLLIDTHIYVNLCTSTFVYPNWRLLAAAALSLSLRAMPFQCTRTFEELIAPATSVFAVNLTITGLRGLPIEV